VKGLQKCRLNGEPVYAFKVINENEIMDVQYEKRLRKASEEGTLKCEDCGSDAIFRFGKVKIPHFAHKSEMLGGGCEYSRESEEHILGKKLLLDLMLKHYPDAEYEVRYRFANKKWADLFIKFNNKVELVIEFQRSLNSIQYWESKKEFYKEISLNNLWIVAGKREEFEEIVREYGFMFHHRLILNDNNNKLYILDIENRELLIASKIEIKDDLSNEVIMDKIFFRTYGLNTIKILPDGTIDCNFDSEYVKEKETFVQAYLKERKRQQEEQERIKKEQEEEQKRLLQLLEEQKRLAKEAEEERRRVDELARRKRLGSSLNVDINTNNRYNNRSYANNYQNYIRGPEFYRDKVNKAILGNRYDINYLAKVVRNGGSDEYHAINNLFQEEINKGNSRAKRACEEVMRLAGLG
jgi:competence CoiA-like predicted nuclease